jgi:hypothetical protein
MLQHLISLMAFINQDHIQIADYLKKSVEDIVTLQNTQADALATAKQNVLELNGLYYGKLHQQLRQAKVAYIKKSEAMVDAQDSKYYKTQRDANEAELIYRNKISKIESVRCQLQSKREKGKVLFKSFENESFKIIRDSFTFYGNLLQVASSNMRNAAEQFESVVHHLQPFQFPGSQFEVLWRPLEPIFAEDFPSGIDLQDLVFGAPLDYSIRLIPDIIPPFLKFSIHEIENRGLDVEGIYRVAGKTTEKTSWKTKIEINLLKVDFGAIDIHVLTSLVKQFFRDLPEPLFPMTTTDRIEYANTSHVEERLPILKARVNSLPRMNLSVLKFLVEHLQK